MNFKPQKPGSPMPETMGYTADEYALTRAFRLQLEKLVEPVKQRESELREHMVRNLEKTRIEGGDTGAAGRFYRVQIKDKPTPRVSDWKEFYAYVQKEGRFDLLRRQITERATMDQIEAGDAVPGVEIILIPDVSVVKI
jgi:hypothetical protein